MLELYECRGADGVGIYGSGGAMLNPLTMASDLALQPEPDVSLCQASQL